MPSINKVILIGHLGRDPEVKYFSSGDAVCNLSLATTEKWKDKQGQQQEQTEWHRVNLFGRTAEICGEYLRKGSAVYIEGSIHTRKYTDKQGIERYATEIKGYSMQILGGGKQAKEDHSREQAPAQSKPTQSELPGGFQEMDDDLPF